MAVLFATNIPGSDCSVPVLWSISGLAWNSLTGTMWDWFCCYSHWCQRAWGR